MTQSRGPKQSMLSLFYQLSLALGTTLDRAQESKVFMDWLVKALRPKFAALFLVDDEHQSLNLAQVWGTSVSGTSLPLGLDPWQWLRDQGAPIPASEHLQAHIVPMVVEGELQGLLLYISRRRGSASAEEQRLVELAMGYFAPHVRNIHRYRSVERLVEQRTAELRRSEERHRYISELISDYAYSFRVLPDGSLQGEWLSESFTNVFGFTREEIAARGGWQSVALPDDLPRFTAHIQKLLSGQSDVCEGRFVTRQGDIRWIRDYAAPVWDEEKTHIVRIFGAARDITERKRAEQALRESEARFRRLAENAIDLIYRYEFRPKRGFTYVNPAATAITGYTPEDHYADPDLGMKIVHPDDRPQLENYFRNEGAFHQPIVLRWMRKDGTILWTEQRNVPVFNEEGQLIAIEGIARDITERRLAEEALQRQVQELILLHQTASLCAAATDEDDLIADLSAMIGQTFYTDDFGIFVLDAEEGVLHPHPSYHQSTGTLTPSIRIGEGIIGQVAQTGKLRRVADVRQEKGYIAASPATLSELAVPVKLGERVIAVINTEKYSLDAFTEDDERLLGTIAGHLATAIERIRLHKETIRRAEQATALLATSRALAALDLDDVLQTIGEHAKALFHADGCRIALIEPDGQTLRFVLALHERAQAVKNLRLPMGQGLTGSVAASGKAEIVNDGLADPRSIQVPGTPVEAEAMMFAPLQEHGRVIGVLSVSRLEHEHPFTPEDLTFLEALASQASIVITNARRYEEIRQRARELEALQKISTSLRVAQSTEEALPLLLDETLGAIGAQDGSIMLYNPETDDLRPAVFRGWFRQLDSTPLKRGEGIAGWMIATGQTHYYTADIRSDPHARKSAVIPADWGLVGLSIRVGEEIIGVLFVSTPNTQPLTEAQISLLSSVAEIAGITLHRLRLHEDALRRVEYLQTVHTIDLSIAASMDLHLTLTILLNHTMGALGADAVGILLYHAPISELAYAAGRGFRRHVYEQARLRLGEGLAGQAALERRLLYTLTLDEASEYARKDLLEIEGFVTHFAVPLVAKGQLHGVLEVFHRRSFQPDSEWLNFLEMLARQAAIAIDNARLFESLERANLDLRLAYDATIAGWSRALELRDELTEGHTQRVTEMSVRLAQAMGMSHEQLAHVRHGALLHDIGKIAISDSILRKPDKLTDEEWTLMRRHPTIAYEMLSSVSYLRPALDIPYCHHEKWDGTGYPQGLKGAQIPLAARIFAVCDVFDALTSDRPYRKAWTRDDALHYIRDQSGKHFDPQVVSVFLKLIEEQQLAD